MLLIDKEKLLHELCGMCCAGEKYKCRNPFGECDEVTVIKKQPVIKAEIVKHGIWVNDVFCSECNRFPVDVSVSISNRELTKYLSRCPHCGAKMKRGAENA